MEVSDRYYYSNLRKYNNFLFEYWQKEDQAEVDELNHN